METLRIDILNPKAKKLLNNLAELNLIKIKKDKSMNELADLLDKLRVKNAELLSLEEINSEVEEVRKKRYES